MTFRNLDSNHDWTFGKGLQNYVKESKEIAINIETRLLSFLNDCFFAIQDGIDWFNHLGGKDRDVIILDVRKIINSTEGVRRINSVDFFENSSRQLIITYNIDTIYSTGFANNVEVLSV
jgi:hypothetical protein